MLCHALQNCFSWSKCLFFCWAFGWKIQKHPHFKEASWNRPPFNLRKPRLKWIFKKENILRRHYAIIYSEHWALLTKPQFHLFHLESRRWMAQVAIMDTVGLRHRILFGKTTKDPKAPVIFSFPWGNKWKVMSRTRGSYTHHLFANWLFLLFIF